MTATREGWPWRAALLAFGVRLVVVAYAAGRFPPADDGTFYHAIADRIARGLGYTWAWPDGTVTFAANYPVGYPALLAPFYALLGAQAWVAMLVNAALGAAATWAAVVLASRVAAPRGALVAGLAVALEPALVLYTPAVMTEAVAGELLVIAAALATTGRWHVMLRTLACGLVLGVMTLVRPELFLVVPFVGALAAWREPKWRRLLRDAACVTVVALAVCLPWTLRNCARLDRCAFVSANAGQNLLIGTSTLGHGGWVGLDVMGVPPECRTVFGEGGKDRCFAQAASQAILHEPGAWLALVPKKLAVTFDYGSAAAHYLAASNPALVGERTKTALGVLEFAGERCLLVMATLALARAKGPRARLRNWLALACVVLFFVVPVAWVGFVLFIALGASLGRQLVRLPPLGLAVAVVGATALTHALFFGAGRYALVCVPALGTLSALLWPLGQKIDTARQ